MTNQSVIMPRSLPAAKRTLILEAARRLLVRRGFQNVVLDDVAREADVAKGTLFLHFKNKEELIGAAFADMVDRLGESLEAVSRSDARGEALLSSAVETILAHFERNHDFMSHFGGARFPKAKLARNLGLVRGILGQCAEAGLMELKDPDTAALSLFGLCRTAVFHRAVTGDGAPFTARTPKVVDFFLHGVGAPR